MTFARASGRWWAVSLSYHLGRRKLSLFQPLPVRLATASKSKGNPPTPHMNWLRSEGSRRPEHHITTLSTRIGMHNTPNEKDMNWLRSEGSRRPEHHITTLSTFKYKLIFVQGILLEYHTRLFSVETAGLADLLNTSPRNRRCNNFALRGWQRAAPIPRYATARQSPELGRLVTNTVSCPLRHQCEECVCVCVMSGAAALARYL
ncbi:hypothetical protein J6590_034984 [Homalodisca vitripennis]|nr:hypothetical protein J6590_034984 [Homalodisca vitripennis]